MKKLLKIFLVLTLLVFVQVSCNTTDPKLEPELLLKLEDVSCTEAWLQLSTNNIQLPATINLLKNNTVAQTFSLSTKDSLLYIDSLLPNQTYKVSATMQQGNNASNELTITTMDTTSHNFSWQTFEFGQHSSSVLNDVAIIDENNIWAVGEIFMNDSLGNPDPTCYNAVHWNGQSWELKKIGGIGGWACHTIFAFSTNDIWFEGTIHWNGANYTVHKNGWPLMPNGDGWQVNKMWGSSSNDLYAVGNNGNIARYNGSSWTKIESGTTTDINDAWGVYDSGTDNSLVLCTVSSRYHLGEYKLLSISGNTVKEYVTWPYTRLYGLWFNSPKNIYIVGDGAYVYKNNNLNPINLPSNYFLTRIKGNTLNDIYISTSGAEIIHYNGTSWKEMSDGVYGKYEGMDVKGSTVALVGYNIEGGIVGKAVIRLGKHF